MAEYHVGMCVGFENGCSVAVKLQDGAALSQKTASSGAQVFLSFNPTVPQDHTVKSLECVESANAGLI